MLGKVLSKSAIVLVLLLATIIITPVTAPAQTVMLEYSLYNAPMRDGTTVTTELVPTIYDMNAYPFRMSSQGQAPVYLGGAAHPELQNCKADSIRFSWVGKHASADSIKTFIASSVAATGASVTNSTVDSCKARESRYILIPATSTVNATKVGAVLTPSTGNAKSLTVPNNVFLKIQWFWKKP